MNKVYQYYSILEINKGEMKIHKNVIPFPYKKLKESQYKAKLNLNYSKSILDSSLFDKVGLINLTDIINFETNKSSYPKFTPINLIIAKYNEEIIANDLPIPDRNGNLIENSEYFIRNEHYVSSLAIKHYLDNNNPKYLKDVNKLQSVIDEINKSHFNNLKFMDPQLDAPNFIITHLNNNCSPDIAEYINECIINSKEIQKFYLSSIASYREYDLYENQGLREFEIGNGYYNIFSDSEVWEKPTNSEIKLEWINETTKWDENLIDSLILISEKHKKEIYLKVSFDYPVIESFYNYHIL
jgi:hypothetical protein